MSPLRCPGWDTHALSAGSVAVMLVVLRRCVSRARLFSLRSSRYTVSFFSTRVLSLPTAVFLCLGMNSDTGAVGCCAWLLLLLPRWSSHSDSVNDGGSCTRGGSNAGLGDAIALLLCVLPGMLLLCRSAVLVPVVVGEAVDGGEPARGVLAVGRIETERVRRTRLDCCGLAVIVIAGV